MLCSRRRHCCPPTESDNRDVKACLDHDKKSNNCEVKVRQDHSKKPDNLEVKAHPDHHKKHDNRDVNARPDHHKKPDNRDVNARPDCDKEIILINQMRLVWEQHVYWTRMSVISIAENRKDKDDTVKRLLQNPEDLAKIFAQYYSAGVADTIKRLVTEHLTIAAGLVADLRDGKSGEAEIAKRKWYENADMMSDAFAGINPHYSRDEVKRMFYRHLDLTAQEAAMRLEGNYPADISVFDMAEQEILAMADMFTVGILEQFPERFR